MERKTLTKLALLDALSEGKRVNPHKEAFQALLNTLTEEQKHLLFRYFRFQQKKYRGMLLTACKYMAFEDSLLRNVTLSNDPGIRKSEAEALIRVKKLRK